MPSKLEYQCFLNPDRPQTQVTPSIELNFTRRRCVGRYSNLIYSLNNLEFNQVGHFILNLKGIPLPSGLKNPNPWLG